MTHPELFDMIRNLADEIWRLSSNEDRQKIGEFLRSLELIAVGLSEIATDKQRDKVLNSCMFPIWDRFRESEA